MIATVLRKELHEFIDTIPDQNLAEIKSYITSLFDDSDPELVIEEASPEEIAMIEEDLEEFRKNPASFRPYEEVRKKHPQL